MIRSLLASALALGLISNPTALRAETVSIVTGLDASASINSTEFLIQIDGMAEGLRSPAVLRAIHAGDTVRFAVFIWADGEQRILLPWTVIASQEDADQAAALLTAAARDYTSSGTNVGTLTDVSGALQFAWAMLNQFPPVGRQITNIAGNGEDNNGGPAEPIRDAMLASGVIINGVVIGGDKDVVAYYRASVVGGRGHFVQALGSADNLAAAFAWKFSQDLASVQ